MGRTARNGLSIDLSHRSTRRHLLQQDRQRARRTHYGGGDPGRHAETKGLALRVMFDWRWPTLFTRVAAGLLFGIAGVHKPFIMTPQVQPRKLFLEPYQHTW